MLPVVLSVAVDEAETVDSGVDPGWTLVVGCTGATEVIINIPFSHDAFVHRCVYIFIVLMNSYNSTPLAICTIIKSFDTHNNLLDTHVILNMLCIYDNPFLFCIRTFPYFLSY